MKKLLTALLISASATAMASDAEIKSKLQALGAKNIEVKDSPVKGLKTAVTDQGILYVSENGQYVLQGKMYELTNKGPVDVAGKFLADKVNALKSEIESTGGNTSWFDKITDDRQRQGDFANYLAYIYAVSTRSS